MITTGSGCPKNKSTTIEDGTWAVAAKIKAINPKALVGMYWRTDMALEVAQCSKSAAALAKHGTDFFLRDDNGTLIQKGGHYLWDYTNEDGRAFWSKTLVNVVNQVLPTTGAPTLDYIYLDGPDWNGEIGVGPARSALIGAAKMKWLAELQVMFSALPGGGRNVILNGCDTTKTAVKFNPTGAAGTMLDHWSILQVRIRVVVCVCVCVCVCARACARTTVCAYVWVHSILVPPLPHPHPPPHPPRSSPLRPYSSSSAFAPPPTPTKASST